MILLRNIGLPVVLILVCAVGVFAQALEAIERDKVSNDKKSESIDLLNNVTPLQAYLIPGNASQLISASTYAFLPQNSVALEDMSSGTTQLVGPSADDTASAVTNIGFDFWYDGVRYSQFSVNANGLARLGSTAVATTFNNSTSGLDTTVNAPKIAAYFEDLCTGASGKVHYKVTGSAPNRKLVVEWFNMEIPRDGSCGTGSANGVFQMWLFESASSANPGRIQFVYGAGIAPSTATDLGASVGLQAGAATNFASVTVSDDTVSYTTANNTNLPGIAAGKSYIFTPNVPAAPTGLSFTPVTQLSIQLNWTDNATNEIGYAVYRSTDGSNFSFVNQIAADSTSFNDNSNLLPGTTYFYRVYAVTDGALSDVLSGSQATDPAGSDSCAGAGGLWSSSATWVDGSVPTAADNVTIGAGCTVTIDVTNAVALNIVVQSGAVLQFIDTPASQLTTVLNLTINSGGTVQTASTGTTTTHLIQVGGDLINNGILDLSTNSDTAGAELRFVGPTNNMFAGTGATTDLRLLTVNKGSGTVTPTSPTLDINLSNMTVRGLSTGGTAGFLNTATLVGIVKFSGTNTFDNTVFQTAGYSIPSTGGFWLNNPNFTVNGQNGSPTMNGLLRITDGTFNVGTSTGNSMGGGAGAQFIIEGGTSNFAGRLQTTSAVSYSQSGGTVNVCTVGNTATTACFGLTAAANVFNLTGGSIVLVLPNTNATPLDWSVSTTSTFLANPAGTTLQLGNGSTPAASTFRVLGNTPNILISTGQTMAVGGGTAGGAVFFRGSTVTNNGAIVVQGTGASSRFDWAASGPMSYGGSGTFGTAATPFAGVGMSANGNNTTINSPIFINRINVFTGGFINSNQITLGSGGTSATVIQVGNSTTPTNAGTFDVSPVYNTGSGGHTVLSLRTTTLNRPTGFEINPTRTLGALTIDDNAVGGSLNVVGGDITVTGTLTLTNGVVVTGANTVIHNGTAARTNGYVNGNLRRSFAAAGTYTYHVGDGGYSPVAANVTAGTGDLTVSAVGTAQPNIPTPSKALSRYWKLAGTGITSDLTFSYNDPADIPGTATEANFVIMKYDGAFTQPGGTVNTAANTATITGVTSFSDWTLADPLALVAPGVLALSSSTYSANENAGSVMVTVNRTSGTDGAVTVDYAFSGGTATGGAACAAGIDYVNTGGTLNFANGEASKTFNVTLCGDTDLEPDETFDVTLSNPTGGATIGSPSSATVTILNDDTPSDPVTVTATAGTPTGSYMTLTAAIAAVNDGTHQGDIVISINQNTTEPGTIVINGSGAGAANYTSLLIRPTGNDITVAGASAQGRGLIELNGADNVTIDGDNPNSLGGNPINRNLTIQNTAANTVTFTSVIRVALATTVVNTADNNTFKNLNILGSATGLNISTATNTTGSHNTTFGIFLGPGASTTVATNPPAAVTSVSTGVAAGATANNLTISNNNVRTAARAISINGSATTVVPGLQIKDNSVGNPTAGDADQVYSIGITAQGSTNALISGNTVWIEGWVASSAATHGINVGVNSVNITGATIENNKVNRVRNNNGGTWSAFGINLGGGSSHIVQNNFVSGVINSQAAGTGGFGTTFGAYGIRIASGTGHKIYHNSVHLYDPMPGTTSTNLTAAFLMTATSQTGVDVRNNIFSNQVAGGNPTGTRNVAVYLPSGGTATMNLTWNNNAYFVGTDALNRLAQVGTTFGAGEYQAADFDPTQTTPATNFRAYTSALSAAGTNDNASFASISPPPFTSNVDLHIPAGTATRLESGGAAVGVTTDIDLETRNATTPDIGADEFAGLPPAANDIAATGFIYPANGATIPAGSFTPQARFTNNGTATQTSVTVRYRIIDSSMTVIYNQTASIPTIAPLQSVVVSFPSAMVPNPGTYSMEASAELAGDTVPGNDTISGTFTTVTPVGGTVTVGAGGDYTSLTNPGGLFQALNLAGISGNVTVNITSDLTAETGAVPLNQLAESGAGGYTVTFKPSGAARVISGTSATSAALIKLNGADRIVFDGSLSGGTDRSLTITNNQTGTSTVFWIASASAANSANNNTIKNTIINGVGTATAQTTAGILGGSGTTIGGPAEAPNNDNTVTNNHIYGVQNSIYNQGNTGFDQNWTITDNEFGSTVEAEKNRFRGMLMGNANNFVISGNTVLGVTNFTGTTGANTGIQLAFAVTNGQITNNRISNVHNLSASGTGAFGMQLSATPTTNILIANNFIWDIQAAGSATVNSNGHGITINGAATAGGYKIYHNSINLNTNQASGTTAALNITSVVVASGVVDLRNNILANTQTSGATRFAVFTATGAGVFSTIDYNDYFAQNVGSLGGTTRTTLTDWQTATGQDANSKAVDPLFVSPTDLHLQPASPLLGMGVSGTGVTTDIDGQTRDTPPDIGADELPAAATPGTVQFDSATYSVGEAGGTVTLTVTRTGGSSGAISVNYATANGTATGGGSCAAGIDFVNASGTLNWADGDTASKTFNVTICNDAAFEADETFTATLSGATGGATIGTPNPATVTITNDDPPPTGTITVNDVRVFEGNTGGANAVFTVTYTGANPASASVNYATASGTAISGVDFIPVSGTLNFSSGTSLTVTVPIIGKSLKEANETFFLNLSGAVNATITDNQGVGIIIDEDRAYVADFDRDLYSDLSVFRPSEGNWYIFNSASNSPNTVAFGTSGDRPVPGDYDGDGKTDAAVYRPSTGTWYVLSSLNSSVQITNWGASGDKPVQGDYDGDGYTDIAIFRPSTGTWWITRSSDNGTYTVPFGISTDRLVQGDYDGDFKTDQAVYRDGTWYIQLSSNGSVVTQNFGLASDTPVSGDFDGDGKYDLAIFRSSSGDFWVLGSLTGTAGFVHWGQTGDIPVPADYDRDGTTDFAIFRPSTGEWYVLRSSNGSYFSLQWGLNGDIPIPAAYLPQ
jgi:hypothetical protein